MLEEVNVWGVVYTWFTLMVAVISVQAGSCKCKKCRDKL